MSEQAVPIDGGAQQLEAAGAGLGSGSGGGGGGGGDASGQALASGDLALPDGVPQKRALPAFATPGGTLGLSKTNMSSFDLAPVPKAAKTMYDHLRVPYFDALLTIVLLIVAIGLSLGSYFAPWMSVTVSTFESPFQTFLLEFSVGIVHYACWGEFCSPQDYKASYSVFMNFWYTQVNNGGFAPYPNITPASGDPGNTATALAALGCFFGVMCILATAANAAAMKRAVMGLPPHAPTLHWFVRCCPPPGRWFTAVRALTYAATAFTCHTVACLFVWGATPNYLYQMLVLNSLLPWTNGVIPQPTYGMGTFLGAAAALCYAAALALSVRTKLRLRAGAQGDKGSKYPLVALLGSSETSHWCC